MSILDEILEILSAYHRGYRFTRARIHGYSLERVSVNGKKVSVSYFYLALHRLKKKGLAENRCGDWYITRAGRRYVQKLLPSHSKRYGPAAPRSIIIVFDVPENLRKRRDWLRAELLCLGFSMLQKSVWIGPVPLPEKFLLSLKDLKLLDYVKLFEVEEEDIISLNG